jgi:phosphatidylserine/phosphatidylglycerophosphate/cardiolipin synthase-like enzyme
MTHAVSIIVEPNGNHANELASAISSAHSAVYMTMYELDASNIITALVGRKQAGLDVQVILDGSTTNKSFNMPAYDQLSSAGISVVWSDPTFTYTHEKCVMIDGTAAWIMTMNANTSSPTNREFLAIDTDPDDVAEAVAVFAADHAKQAITPSGGLVVANENARTKLVALIDSATTTLDIEGEEFSDTYSTGIVRAVVRAAQRGVSVHVIIGNSTPDATAIMLAKNGGANVVVTGPTSGNSTPTNPYIHAKAILVDCANGTCASGFVGSENFSAGSLGYNREVGVIFDVAAELAKIKTAIDIDYSKGIPQ